MIGMPMRPKRWRLHITRSIAVAVAGVILSLVLSPIVRADPPGQYVNQLLDSVRDKVEQRRTEVPQTGIEFLKTLVLMEQIQTIVSPKKYSELSVAGSTLPRTVEDCLKQRAGICGNQVACFLALAEPLELRARPVEFYLHGDQPEDNSSHIGVEVFFREAWHFFDITWGTFFEKEKVVLDILGIRKLGSKARTLAVTNELDPWYLHWKRSGLDPLIYVDHPKLDLLRGRRGNIRLFTTNSVFRPFHQPGYIGLNSQLEDYGSFEVTLKNVPKLSRKFTILVTGIAGRGHLTLIQNDKTYQVNIESLKIGQNQFDLPFQVQPGDIKMKVQQKSTRAIGYVVYSEVGFE